MRILAIRLREVGPFSKPVAIEGLSGGLDVLAGGNEIGKSTVFRAIRSVFFTKHTATGKAVDALRARGGGEPLIEIDFETGEGRFRITKHFGWGSGAELSDLSGGRTLARAADAEEQLSKLVGADGGGKTGLLWVGQRDSLDIPEPAASERAAVVHAVENEVQAITGGAEARAVEAKIAGALGELISPARKTAKKNGPLDLARRRLADIEGDLERARAEADDAADKLDELARLNDRLGEIASPQRKAELKAAIAETEGALSAGRHTHQKAMEARSALNTKEFELQRMAGALEEFDQWLDELQRLNASMATDENRAGELQAECDDNAQALERREQVLAGLIDEERLLLEQSVHRERADTRAAAQRRLTEAARALDVARRLDKEIAEATAQVNASPATKGRFEEVLNAEREIALDESRLGAAAPRLRIALTASGRGKVRAGGEPIIGDTELRASRPLVLEIEGIGMITVVPGSSEDGTAAQARLAALKRRFQKLLSEMGVGDADAAREARARIRNSEQAIEKSRAMLSGLAPEGIDALSREVGELKGQLDDDVDTLDLPQQSDIAERIGEVARRLASERSVIAASRAAHDRVMRELSLAQAKADNNARRQKVLEERLGPEASRQRQRSDLKRIHDDVVREANDLRRQVAAFEETAPEGNELERLEHEFQAARAAEQKASDEAHRLQLNVRHLEGLIEAADEAGVGRRVGELEGELERARAEVEKCERDVAVLDLLGSTLEEAQRATRDKFVQPVIKRIVPYLNVVFPEAKLVFDDKLRLTGLTRGGVVEDAVSLSDGTQEQLAVLVRLGFGRLLAEAGTPVPVILDDALVYSDDERIGRMFAALQLASRAHQVIVFTCRQKAFAGLDGQRLDLEPWRVKSKA